MRILNVCDVIPNPPQQEIENALVLLDDALLMPLGSMPRGDIQAVHGDIEDAFRVTQKVLIEYESLSGVKYRTSVTRIDGVLNTQFHKVTTA